MDNIEKLLVQIRKKPGRADLHNSLGNLYQQKGNQPEAIKHFLTAARLFSMANSPSRNLNKALAILRKMVRDFPDHYDPYFLLADTLREMDQQEEACHVYRSLSDLYRRDGKHLMAVSVFDKVLSHEPAGLDSLVRFGELNQEAGMPFHAAQAFMKAATLYCGENRGEEAPELVMRALKLDPENREAFELFGVLSREGKIQESQEREILKLAEEVDRGGQYDQAVALLGLLESSALREEAGEAIRKIRKHSGLSGEEGEGDREGRKFLSEELRGIKVLVVEDEREILLLLEQILAGEGLQVFTATDGEKGLEVFLRERPHLVVSDAMLPKLHGFELCRRIKEESPLGTKVMILTAVYKKYKYKGKVQEEYGVDEYLDKPFQITEFLEVISRMAEGVKKRARFDLLSERKKGKAGADRELSLLLAVRNDADLLAKVTVFCERKNIRMVRARDPRELIELLMSGNPDLFLFSDPFEGIDTDIIGPLLRDVLGNKWATLVLVSRDKSRMEGPHGYFDHRIFAPVDHPVLENVMSLHLSTRPASGDRRKGGGSFEEKRFESILRNKVERIIKSHSQLEEHFSSRIHELEAQNARLKEALSREKPDED
ncbi:MAG: response regulator [Proteobacteria bacterium]|nr:response regulator [Pseudomonadota bacterium]